MLTFTDTRPGKNMTHGKEGTGNENGGIQKNSQNGKVMKKES